jgi:hypothetical protein
MDALQRRSFDLAFETACRKHQVHAAFVMFLPDPLNPRAVTVLTGGEKRSNALLDVALAAGKHAISGESGEDVPVTMSKEALLRIYNSVLSGRFYEDHDAAHEMLRSMREALGLGL